jgi:flagellar biosynthetic protein FlhB
LQNRYDRNTIKYPYNLQFFADGPGGEKTEDATSKKLTDARKDGKVAKSTEIVMAASLLGLFLLLKFYAVFMGSQFSGVFNRIYSLIPSVAEDGSAENVLLAIIRYVLIEVVILAAPFFIMAVAVALIGNVAQVGWQISTKPMEPDLSKFNPVSGMKKLFSKDKLIELLKSVLKIAAVSYMVYTVLVKQVDKLLTLYDMGLFEAVGLVGGIVIDIGIRISILFLFIGICDVFYQNRKFKNDMKMTKQEVKDEYKNTEGDPQVKGRIRGKMREASQRRMMQELPKADVVITNPTHLAVAIKYDKDKSQAPVVVAKGADYLAEKIKTVARENQVEIVENKPLARMLYYNVEIGDEIPAELYQMVAEVLAYVYRLQNKI